MKQRYDHHEISKVLEVYVDQKSRDGILYSEEPPQDILADFLTDLRHFCRATSLDFDRAVKRSAMHYDEEVDEPMDVT